MSKLLVYVHAYAGKDHNGGAETTLHDNLRYLIACGWEITVLLDHPIVAYDYEGVRVIGKTSPRQPLDLLKEADIGLSHLKCSRQMQGVGAIAGRPVVQYVHNDKPWTRAAIRGYKNLIFNSQWVKESLNREGLVIHPVVDPARYKSYGTHEYITLVNLFPQKGSETFYFLAEYFPNQKFMGVIGGYEQAAQDIRKLPNVIIAPHTEDIKSIYKRTGLILMPSEYESYGRVAVEAACTGIPSLVSDTPGLREAMGHTGRYIQHDDLEGWVEALQDHLEDTEVNSKWAKFQQMSKRLWTRSQRELIEFETYMTELAKRGV